MYVVGVRRETLIKMSRPASSSVVRSACRSAPPRATRRWRASCSRATSSWFRLLRFGVLAGFGAGCFYIPVGIDDVNSPPKVVVPSRSPAIYYMISPSNPRSVTVRDDPEDFLRARWDVPGYDGPRTETQTVDGPFTTFTLTLPRIESLHDRIITVTIFDDDPDNPESVDVEFTVKVQ